MTEFTREEQQGPCIPTDDPSKPHVTVSRFPRSTRLLFFVLGFPYSLNLDSRKKGTRINEGLLGYLGLLRRGDAHRVLCGSGSEQQQGAGMRRLYVHISVKGEGCQTLSNLNPGHLMLSVHVHIGAIDF